MYADNMQANEMCAKNKVTERNKYIIKVRQRKIREYVVEGDLYTFYSQLKELC